MSGVPTRKHNGFYESAPGLYEKLQAFGCPMMDDTAWVQSDSGVIFQSPDGIVTAASWLPCVSQVHGETLPGTCGSCDVHRKVHPQVEGLPSTDDG